MSANLIKFYKYSPGGNITALILGSKSPKENSRVARKVMKSEKEVEQVAFLNPKLGNKIFLRMMGNEFCLNAARVAGAYYFDKTKKTVVKIQVSGFAKALEINKKPGNIISARVPMQILKRNNQLEKGWLVELEGIKYFIGFNLKNFEKDMRGIIKAYKRNSPAMGVINVFKNENLYFIKPVVWVKLTNSLTHETACASGSVAVALVLKQIEKKKSYFSLIQPSGVSYKINLSKKYVTVSSRVKNMGIKQITA